MTIDDMADQGPPELRDALQREKEKSAGLEAKLAAKAFDDAGFPEGSTERATLDEFYDGDRTDPKAIATFAADKFKFVPATEETPPGDDPEHTDPAPTVVADILSEELDSSAADATAPEVLTETVNALLQIAIEHGEGNHEQIEAAMAAELQGRGFMPDKTYTGAPLVG